MKRLLLLALFTLIAANAAATDFAGHHLLIPITGRTPGAFGSQWRTDLVVTNAARTGEPVSVRIFLIVDGMLGQPVVANLWPRESRMLADVIATAFGKQQATGIILITTSEPDAKITARARIYNAGSISGQYGQTVPAMPLTKLSREAVLTGLTAVNGVRTNVGIANPSDKKAGVSISVFDVDGNFSGAFSTEVGAYQVLRLNDVFNYFQTGPLHGATIQVRSTHGVYPFASIIQNDSGDADFVTGVGTEIDDSGAVVKPQCTDAAQLSLAALPSGGWTMIYKPGVDPWSTTGELEEKHNFEAKDIYQFGGFFVENLTQAQIAALRCESSIRVVEQSGYIIPIF